MGKKKKNKKQRIRPLAICVFRREDQIFVARGYDSVNGCAFYRPIGGRIEFGERGRETVTREVKEEIDAEVIDVRYLGALENIFQYEGKPGHEIVLVYDGRFADPALNRNDAVVQGQDDGGILYQGEWRTLAAFHDPTSPPLYPKGLLQLLRDHDKP